PITPQTTSDQAHSRLISAITAPQTPRWRPPAPGDCAVQALPGTRRAALLGTCARAAPLGAIRPRARARWLWHAIDHHTGRVLAYVVGSWKDTVFLKLKALLASIGLKRYYTDKAGVYQRYLPPEQHTVGKMTMQKIERKHLTLRTRLKRLARKTLCFSRSYLMHDLLIGLYMNRVEFGCAV